MSVQAPAFITIENAVRGEEMTITWGEVPGAISYVVERSFNGAPFGNVPQYDVFSVGGTYAVFTVGEDWNTLQYRVKALKSYDDGTFEYSDWTISEIVTVQEVTPPIPVPITVKGRLEQFQNSEGTNVYPKTIVEGVFRQSDGKRLGDVLDEIEKIPGPPGPPGKIVYATFYIDTNTGELIMVTPEGYSGPTFRLNGANLEAVINYGD